MMLIHVNLVWLSLSTIRKKKKNSLQSSVIVKARDGGTVEEQGLEVAAAHLVPPLHPLPVPPSAPPTASVTFALCSSCRVFWKGHLQLLAASWHRGEWAMWREAAATGLKGPPARFLSTYCFIPFLVWLLLLQRVDICTLVVSRWS